MNNRILPLAALLAAIGIIFFYVAPTWSGSIAETKAKIASDDEALRAATEYAEHQNELAAKRNAIDLGSLERLATFLPDSVDNVGIILDLNALAARSGLSLVNVDVTSDSGSADTRTKGIPVGQSPVGSVDLALSAVGPYAALQTFLAGVEQSVRLLDVRDIVVKGSDTGVYNYQLQLRLYWLR